MYECVLAIGGPSIISIISNIITKYYSLVLTPRTIPQCYSLVLSP